MEKVRLIPVVHLENDHAVVVDHAKKERFYTDPIDLVVELDELGFDEILVIDDDGEKKGEFSAYSLVNEMINYSSANIICKGGLRSIESIQKAFEAGASQCMITSLPIKGAEEVAQLIDIFGSNSFIINFDLKEDHLVYEDRNTDSDKHIEDLLHLFVSLGMENFSIHFVNDLNEKVFPSLEILENVLAHFSRIRLYAGEGINEGGHFEAFEESGIWACILGDEFYTNEDLFAALRSYRVS